MKYVSNPQDHREEVTVMVPPEKKKTELILSLPNYLKNVRTKAVRNAYFAQVFQVLKIIKKLKITEQ